MPGPLFQPDSFRTSKSWLTNFHENLRQLLARENLSAASANGAPLHLLKTDRARPNGRAQTASMVTHGVVIAAILLAAAHPTLRKQETPKPPGDVERLSFTPPPTLRQADDPSLGERGGSGNHDPIPATSGFFPPESSIQFAKPRLPLDKPNLPMPMTILNEDAPPILRPTTDPGLPWMPDKTNSQGPGAGGSFGRGKNEQDGDDDGSGTGFGGKGIYANAVTRVMCAMCPDPLYTDEARREKAQGVVTLRVLVGPDGRAADIRLVKSLGFGLDERAVETVRGWKFVPARDAAHHPVASWVTIEAVYRLM